MDSRAKAGEGVHVCCSVMVKLGSVKQVLNALTCCRGKKISNDISVSFCEPLKNVAWSGYFYGDINVPVLNVNGIKV